MSTDSPERRPWRSAYAGWIVTALALLAGVPLFMSMPPWNDVTLHDMAVRAMLHGGVHYRDVFDTNLPGIDWSMAVVRMVFGWSYEALRAVDLVVIAAEVVFLLAWVRRAGGQRYTVAWLAASFALFYPFSSEFNHMQRDPWLLLPAVAAAWLRLRRTLRPMAQEARAQRNWPAVIEGVLWGAAVWVKPHVVFPAFAVWAASAALMARRESVRRVLFDLAALVAGGLMAGAVGAAWLVGTGAWPYFLDVFLNWNPSYLDDMWGDALFRAFRTFYCFRPWSILHFAAIPLAIAALWEARVGVRAPWKARKVWVPPWLYTPADGETTAAARALLAAFYLGWLFQATFLQKGMDYVQVPLLFLGMAMVATQRWAFGFAYLLWFAAIGLLVNLPILAPVAQVLDPVLVETSGDREPFDPERWQLWPACWQEPGSAELRDKLGYYTNIHCGTNWEELEQVAGYLRTVKPPLGPGELNCWHDSTHPLYLMLDLDPATRYMHYGTALAIRKQAGQIAADVAASRQRYVVSDLLRVTFRKDKAYQLGPNGDPLKLPRWFPLSQRNVFPWNQPIVFRSGRYLVHKVVNPLGVIDIPDWKLLDRLGPGEGTEQGQGAWSRD